MIEWIMWTCLMTWTSKFLEWTHYQSIPSSSLTKLWSQRSFRNVHNLRIEPSDYCVWNSQRVKMAGPTLNGLRQGTAIYSLYKSLLGTVIIILCLFRLILFLQLFSTFLTIKRNVNVYWLLYSKSEITRRRNLLRVYKCIVVHGDLLCNSLLWPSTNILL